MLKFLSICFKVVVLIVSLAVITMLSTWVTIHFIFQGRDVHVPNLIGLTENQANAKLNQSGLRLKIDQRRHSDSFEEGRIFLQVPAGGAKLKRNRSVKVVVSLDA